MKRKFLHQFCLHISACWSTTKFHCGPAPSSGNINVQKRINAPSVGTMRSNRLKYSWPMRGDWLFLRRPMIAYEVSSPLSIMKASVYIAAALAITDMYSPMSCKREKNIWKIVVELNRNHFKMSGNAVAYLNHSSSVHVRIVKQCHRLMWNQQEGSIYKPNTVYSGHIARTTFQTE